MLVVTECGHGKGKGKGTSTSKGKVVPVNAIKAHGGRRCVIPLIANFGP
jgi:hypothetical protein